MLSAQMQNQFYSAANYVFV